MENKKNYKNLIFVIVTFAIITTCGKLFINSTNVAESGVTCYKIGDSGDVFYIQKYNSLTPTTITNYPLPKKDLCVIFDAATPALKIFYPSSFGNSTPTGSVPFISLFMNYGTDSIKTTANTTFISQSALMAFANKSLNSGSIINGYIAGSTATLVKTGYGKISSINIIGTGSATSYFNAWDGTDSTGTLIGKFSTTSLINFPYSYKFTKGLYIKQAATGSVGRVYINVQ